MYRLISPCGLVLNERREAGQAWEKVRPVDGNCRGNWSASSLLSAQSEPTKKIGGEVESQGRTAEEDGDVWLEKRANKHGGLLETVHAWVSLVQVLKCEHERFLPA